MDNFLTNTDFTGKFLIHLRRVDSTNNYAKEYVAKTNPKDGTVILADEQFSGRGQAGNLWESEALKNLTFSLIYQTDFLAAAEQFYLSMAVSLGLREAVSSALNSERHVRIKWPNDVYVNNLKIAGMLIENTIQGMNLSASIIGIGLNVNQADFGKLEATSLLLENGEEYNRLKILKHGLERVEYYFLELKKGNKDLLKKNYLENLYRFNEWHSFSDPQGNFTGKIVDVNAYGNLVVETENGLRTFGMKEIKYE